MSLPSNDVLYKDVSLLVDELGVELVTMKVLRKRLEDKYQMTMNTEDFKKVQVVVTQKCNEPECQRALAAAVQKKEAEEKKTCGRAVGKGTPPPSKPKREKRVKEEEEGEKGPKKPTTAYFFYVSDQRERVVSANPGMKITEITVLLGQEWKALAEDAKAPYIRKAEEDKKRYEKELAAFKAGGGVLAKRRTKGAGDMPAKKGKAKKEVDPNAPKRPQTAFFLYLNANRGAVKSANPSAKITEITTILTAQWKALREDEKAHYEALAAKEKKIYEEKLSAYNKEKGITGQPKRAAGGEKKSGTKRGKKEEQSSSSSDSSSSDSGSDSGSSSGSDSSSDESSDSESS